MSRKSQQTNYQISKGMTYVASTPSFLKNFGKPLSPPPPPGRGGVSRGTDGREALPERPREGKWARGSDDGSGSESERKGKGKGREVEDNSDDEWGEVYGGGGDDGPQVVVLKEGRHLSAEEVKRERRRAAGLPSLSPSAVGESEEKKDVSSITSVSQTSSKPAKPQIPKTVSTSAKRKLVGAGDKDEQGKVDDGIKAKSGKKKKVDKGLLSFNEEDGEN